MSEPAAPDLDAIRAELVSFAEPFDGADPMYQRGKQYGLQLAIGAIDDALAHVIPEMSEDDVPPTDAREFWAKRCVSTTDKVRPIHIHLPANFTTGETKQVLDGWAGETKEALAAITPKVVMQAAISRHQEPHDCPREGAWSACDFNRYCTRETEAYNAGRLAGYEEGLAAGDSR